MNSQHLFLALQTINLFKTPKRSEFCALLQKPPLGPGV
jgi:hypothetical protein